MEPTYNSIHRMHTIFFLFTSFPFIQAMLTSMMYNVEFGSDAKKKLYTFPIPRYAIFFSKLIIVLGYCLLSLIVLSITVYFLGQKYTSLFGIFYDFPLPSLQYILLSFLAILIGAIPVLSLHLWLSSIKLSLLWNMLLLISLVGISAFLVKEILVNQWYNIYLFPHFFFSGNEFQLDSNIGIKDVIHNWHIFSSHSLPFMAVIILFFLVVFLIGIYYYIQKRDSKY